VNSHWIKDMIGFFAGGWTSSWPKPRRPAAGSTRCSNRPARCATHGDSWQTYFVTNGTSTANKIICQALVQPGDIVRIVAQVRDQQSDGGQRAGLHIVVQRAAGRGACR